MQGAMRIGFALSGFHRHDRGAEVALLAVADAMARGGDQVVVFGSGYDRPGCRYKFQHVPAVGREWFERFPSFPLFRNETAWEDASFAAGLLAFTIVFYAVVYSMWLKRATPQNLVI